MITVVVFINGKWVNIPLKENVYMTGCYEELAKMKFKRGLPVVIVTPNHYVRYCITDDLIDL